MAEQPKKLAPLAILNILRTYSNESNYLSVPQIAQILTREYDIELERKAITRNIGFLAEFGYRHGGFMILTREHNRTFGANATEPKTPNDGERPPRADEPLARDRQRVVTGYAYAGSFSEGEVRLLMDAVADSEEITTANRLELKSKLAELTGNALRCFRPAPPPRFGDEAIFGNLEELHAAINAGRRVVLDRGKQGAETVSPYGVARRDSRHYLLCADGAGKLKLLPFCDLGFVRPDRGARTPFEAVSGGQRQEDVLAAFLPGRAEVTLRVNGGCTDVLKAAFGADANLRPDGTAAVRCGDEELTAFLLCHADAAELIAPQKQRDAMRRRIEAAAQLYCPDLLAS